MFDAAETRAIWIAALEAARAARGRSLWQLIAARAEAAPDAPALIGPDGTLSYAGLLARAGAYAAWAEANAGPGAAVGLMLPNGAEYVAAWLGLAQAGRVAALLNTNLRGAALAHGLAAAATPQAIASPFYHAALQEAGATRVIAPAEIPPAGPPASAPPPPDETALLIYTSGTTGLPKAARITHRRLVEWSAWFAGMMGATAADRMYNCLPLYHSTGGVAAIGSMLIQGGSAVLAEKFSVRRFWQDIAAQNCTVFQYIGELCRYLADAPEPAAPPPHRLRLACGNGMSGPVWQRFQARFAIPRILEFYASTEGNLSLYNVEQKPGAIGRIPPFLARQFPTALIRCDRETAAPLRGADGLCQAAAVDEPGEALGEILNGAAATAFDGYTDAGATAARVLRDVLAPGDAWFRTGDLMRRDAAGFFHFVDRLGDGFRWKGENVSAAEVADVLRTAPGVAAAVAYGVRIPGHEGAAGMAALVPDGPFDPGRFADHVAARLPAYAQPVLVRLCPAIGATATHKPQVAPLKARGYAAEDGSTLWLRSAGTYLPLTDELRAGLDAGSLPR